MVRVAQATLVATAPGTGGSSPYDSNRNRIDCADKDKKRAPDSYSAQNRKGGFSGQNLLRMTLLRHIEA